MKLPNLGLNKDPREISDPRDSQDENKLPDSPTVFPMSIFDIWNWFSAQFGPIASYLNFSSSSNEDPISQAEDEVLRCLKNKYYRYYVETKSGCKIWTLSTIPYPRPDDHPKISRSPLVLLHGLMAGLGYWVMNFDYLVDAGYDIFAIDLPGFARSDRIEFDDDADATERLYLQLIDEWREILSLDRIAVIGHSFGGYITTAYAISFPHHVSHIVLVDPWGFPDVKEDVAAVVEQGDSSNFSNPLAALPIWFRVFVLFTMPFSPFSFIRRAGQRIGPRLIHFIRPDMARRYESVFGTDDCLTIPNYVYHTNKFNPTGEKAFRSLAMPLAWAKLPLIKRISKLHQNVSVSFIYGSRSWIDFQTGFEVKDLLLNSDVKVHVINDAGHHLFADQPELFNSLICQILQGDTNLIDQPSLSLNESSICSIKDIPIS